MIEIILVAALLCISALAYRWGRNYALAAVSGNPRKLHSLPGHYGAYVALWCAIPALVVVALWLILEPRLIDYLLVSHLPDEIKTLSSAQIDLLINDIKNLADGNILSREPDPAMQAAADHYNRWHDIGLASLAIIAFLLSASGAMCARRRIAPRFEAIYKVERLIKAFLLLGSTVAVLTTIGIVLSLLFEALRFFNRVPFWDFAFGTEWSPQTAIRDDQVGSSGAFGSIPVFAGTAMISAIAMTVAVPVGLFAAVFMSEYASTRTRSALKPVLEILAGIPTVVYGFFAALTVAPAIRDMGQSLGLDVASESALAAGMVMGIMIIPFVSSLSDDVLNAVPNGLREASYGVGATRSETILKVLLPAALPGIVGGILLAISRAIGETMIVVMAAGLAANLTANPFEAVTTVTVQIVTLLVGDQEFDSAKTLSAFALGLGLFILTLCFNIVALRMVRKYREQYE
ncbi:MAG: phosphate ABC transporter permease subunit PstC [Proteobacteria bacterium]|nr:phosphate ABC transporter permease subunit PstC [Pseudomonadota bacterium]